MAVVYRTNFQPNPDFRATGSSVTVRTNLYTNPGADTSASYWSAARSTVAQVAGAGATPGSTGFIRVTSTDASSANYAFHATVPGVTAGSAYSASGYVRSATAQQWTAWIQWWDASSAYLSKTDNLPYVSAPANTWVRLNVENVTAPPNAARASLYVQPVKAVPVGDTFDVDSFLLEQSPVVLPYFDGNTPTGFDLNLVSSWTGTVGASTSVAQGASVADWVVPSAAVALAWQAEDGQSVYLRNTSPNTWANGSAVFYSGTGLPISSGSRLSASLRMLSGAGLYITIQGYAGSTTTGTVSSNGSADVQPPDTAKIENFAPNDATGNVRLIIRPRANVAPPGATFRLDQALLEAAPSVGFYFDGDTPNTDGWRTSWTGTAQRSASVMTDVGGLSVNGVDLQNLAFNIVNRSGRWVIPGRRGSNRDLPGLHGTSRLTGKPFDENTVVLTMWVLGANLDGTLPTSRSKRAQVEAYVDQLGRLFTAPTLRLVQPRGDGDRVLIGEVTRTVDFKSMAAATRAEFGVEIVAASPFWRAVSESAQTVVTASANTYRFTTFADITAPLIEATYTVSGPVNSPTLTDPVSGQWVKLATNVPAGQSWVVNSATWTSTLNGANVLAQTSHGLGATFLDLTPDEAGPRLTLSGTGMTSQTSVRVTATKGYLSA